MLPAEEMFESNVRSRGDLAGVFEYDGETAYFYLYSTTCTDSNQIQGAIHILSSPPDFRPEDVKIRWSRDEDKVGLFIRGHLWAVFDGHEKIGGNYQLGEESNIALAIRQSFNTTHS